MRHRYVLEGAALAEVERESFERVMGQRSSEAELLASLASLSDCLARHHGTDVVILIDEYDHMVTEGHLNGYRDFAIDVMRRWLTGALKATTSLFLACLTGVQRVGCESIFSGLNNVVVDTAMDLGFIEGFGFTRAEAEALARYQSLAEDKLPEMHDWYDGYNFGGVEAYNPWSVLNYLRQGGVAQPYWDNTSDNAIVHQLFQKATGESIAELQDLAAGGVVVRPLDLATVFSELDQHKGLRSDAALWVSFTWQAMLRPMTSPCLTMTWCLGDCAGRIVRWVGPIVVNSQSAPSLPWETTISCYRSKTHSSRAMRRALRVRSNTSLLTRQATSTS